MKNNSIFMVVVLAMMIGIGVQSCKKDTCWECVRNAGQIDEVKETACDKDQKERYESSGFYCR